MIAFLTTGQFRLPGSDTNAWIFTRLESGMAVAKMQSNMRDQEYQIGGYDIGLAVFVITTAWLLILQSGLLGK